MNVQNFHFATSFKAARFAYSIANLLTIVSVRSEAKHSLLHIEAPCIIFCHITIYMCSRVLVLEMWIVHELLCMQHIRSESFMQHIRSESFYLRTIILLMMCDMSLFSTSFLSCSSGSRHLGKRGQDAWAVLYWGIGNITYD